MRGASAFVIAALCAGAAPAAGEDASPGDTSRVNSVHFLDKSYIFLSWVEKGDKQLLYEGHPAPNLFFLNNVGDALARLGTSSSITPDVPDPVLKTGARTLVLTPLFRLRNYSTPSAPVRTPSYMPKATLQRFFLSLHDADACRVAGGDYGRLCLSELPRDLLSVQVTAGHHSNGQDGCTFTSQSGAPDECRPAPEALPDLERQPINTRDGSFSIGLYFQLGVFWKRIHVKDSRFDRSLAFGLRAETQVPESFPGGMPSAIQKLYGAHRVRASAEIERASALGSKWARGKWAAGGYVEVLSGHASTVPGAIVSVETTYAFDKLGGWGLFARYYRGQDYYNLRFTENTVRWQLGLVFDGAPFGRFFRL